MCTFRKPTVQNIIIRLNESNSSMMPQGGGRNQCETWTCCLHWEVSIAISYKMLINVCCLIWMYYIWQSPLLSIMKNINTQQTNASLNTTLHRHHLITNKKAEDTCISNYNYYTSDSYYIYLTVAYWFSLGCVYLSVNHCLCQSILHFTIKRKGNIVNMLFGSYKVRRLF